MLVVQPLELLSLIFQFSMYIYIYCHCYYIVVLLYSIIVISTTIIIIIIIIMLYNASYYYRIIHMYGTNLPVATSDLKCLGSQADLEVPNTSSIPFGKAFLRPYFLWGHRSGTLRFFINQMLINKSHTPFNSKTYTFSIHIYIYIKDIIILQPEKTITTLFKSPTLEKTPQRRFQCSEDFLKMVHPFPSPLAWAIFFETGKRWREIPEDLFNSNVSCACLGKT